MAYKRQHDYVNTSEGGPIRIGTDKYKVLQFIYNSGKEGVRYTDIVKFIVEELRGREYTHAQSGYWGTNLLGSGGWYSGSSNGILRMYCEKKKHRPEILDNRRARRLFARYDVNPEIQYELSRGDGIMLSKFIEAKYQYQRGARGGGKGNWVLSDRKLINHFGGGDGKSKRLEILRHARTNLGLPNLNF